jgi:hypothetical protein
MVLLIIILYILTKVQIEFLDHKRIPELRILIQIRIYQNKNWIRFIRMEVKRV